MTGRLALTILWLSAATMAAAAEPVPLIVDGAGEAPPVVSKADAPPAPAPVVTQPDKASDKKTPDEAKNDTSNDEGIAAPDLKTPPISSSRLDELNLAAIGDSTAFPAAASEGFWQGVDETSLIERLNLLPVRFSQRTLAQAQLDLLRAAPRYPFTVQQPLNAVSARIERMALAGWFTEARALLALVPQPQRGETLQRATALMDLLSGNFGAACGMFRRGVSNSTDPFWLKGMIFCHSRTSNTKDALLLVELLPISDQPFYLSVAQAWPRIPAMLEPVPPQDPFAILLAGALRLPITLDEASTKSEPLLLRALLISGLGDNSAQISWAEQAARIGAISLNELQESYLTASFSALERDEAFAASAAKNTPRGRALIFQQLERTRVPAARQNIVLSLLTANQNTPMFPVLVTMTRQSLPTSVSADLTTAQLTTLIKALVLSDNIVLARDYARQLLNLPPDPTVTAVIDSFYPWLRLLKDPNLPLPPDGEMRERWIKAMVKADISARNGLTLSERQSVLYHVLGGLGTKVPELAPPPPPPQPLSDEEKATKATTATLLTQLRDAFKQGAFMGFATAQTILAEDITIQPEVLGEAIRLLRAQEMPAIADAYAHAALLAIAP